MTLIPEESQNVTELIQELNELTLKESEKVSELEEILDRKRAILFFLKNKTGPSNIPVTGGTPAPTIKNQDTTRKHTNRIAKDCQGTLLDIGSKVGFTLSGKFDRKSPALHSGRIIRFTKKHVDIRYYDNEGEKYCLREDRNTLLLTHGVHNNNE